MKTWHMAGIVIWIGITVVLTGCRFGDSSENDTSGLTQAALVKAASADALAAMVKKNLRDVGKVGASYRYYGGSVSIEADAVNSAGASADASSESFSSTNTQEAGVDESDPVKFDGDYLFITENRQQWNYAANTEIRLASVTPGDTPSRIRVLRASPQPPLAAEVASLDINDKPIRNLFLRSNEEDSGTRQLAVIGGGYSGNYWAMWDVMPYWYSSTVDIELYDVTDPAHSEKTWSLSLDGGLIDSRRIGNKLYLVSRYQGNIDGFVAYPADQITADHNVAVVDALQIETLMPKHSINGGEPVAHVNAQDCLIPNEAQATQSYVPYIITITTINLDAPDSLSVTCYAGPASSIYASSDNLYVLDSTYDNVILHKFSFANSGTDYLASGEVPGSIGWKFQNLRLSEYAGDLRIVTNSYVDNANRLFILREETDAPGKLAIVGQLPNETRPDTLGKPGEQLYGVRFFNERGYVITFKQIDPLYVLDLADPTDPLIAGTLEMPGYSDYLQPLSDELLLGIGKDAIETDAGFAWYQGVKVSLFNVADINAPQLIGEDIIGKRGTESPVLGDYHALTLLKNSATNHWRVALPVMVHGGDVPTWGSAEDPSAYYPLLNTVFKFYDIDANAGAYALTPQGELEVADASDDAYEFYDASRSFLQDDAVHVVFGGQVWSAPWGHPEEATGPQ